MSTPAPDATVAAAVPAPGPTAAPARPAPAAAKPIKGGSLLLRVLWDRLKAIFRGRRGA
jgi:hypothetical protein